MIAQLQEASASIKTLNGMLPICAACKKIRDDSGYWNQIESYIRLAKRLAADAVGPPGFTQLLLGLAHVG